MQEVKTNDTIKINYKGTLSDGTVFDQSKKENPLEFKVGSGQVIKGLDEAVQGVKLNEVKTVTIASENAYGPVNKQLVQEVPKSALPQDMQPEVGMQLMSQLPSGQQIPIRIVSIEEASVTIDANHPLAGKDLTFEFEVVEIQAA